MENPILFYNFSQPTFEKGLEGFKFGQIFIVEIVNFRKDPTKITKDRFHHVYGST